MTQISRWKIFLILAVCAYGFAYSAPNFLSKDSVESLAAMSSVIPHKTVNLGLDLRGGAHLLYEVNMPKVFEERADMIAQGFDDFLKEEGIKKHDVKSEGRDVLVRMDNAEHVSILKGHIRKTDPRLILTNDDDGLGFRLAMGEDYVADVQDQTIAQVIEVVRRRIDEFGTTEPVIVRQGDKRVVVQVPGADSSQVRDLVGKTAKLGFHLVGEQGRRKVSEISLPMVESPGQKLNVSRVAMVTGEMLENAQPSFSQQGGGAVVTFRLDAVGARKFCDVTRKHVNEPFAIVLDNEIISAPRINEAICGGSGQISGDFDVREASDLALLLRAGALPADLKVVEERSVGPSLGADSVAAGKIASIIGLVFVLLFMLGSYGLFGLFANLALVINISLILALLSSIQATLTLPGIAGIVLTVGMAVDANVLIFERIREEIAAGRSALSSIDIGYSRAMSTIIDSNLTTLIAAIILFSLGTGPIKGFAVTLGIGICTSMFSAIMVTRLFVVLWTRKSKAKTLPI
ncbi:MAG: protein translocase subunit SecD [Alphaproteobacteria bacterium]